MRQISLPASPVGEMRQARSAVRSARTWTAAEVVLLAPTSSNITGTVIEADGGARLVSLI